MALTPEYYIASFSAMNKWYALYLLFAVCCARGYAQSHNIATQPYALKDTVRLRSIVFEGNKRTKASVLLREMSLEQGDKIVKKDVDDMLEINRKRLMNLSLFSEALASIEVVNDSTIDWRFKLKEQWFIIPELTLKLADRNFNVWWNEKRHDLRRTNLGVMLKHRNLRGRMEQLSATVQVGYTQKFGLEYFRPYIDKKQQNGLGASFFFAKNEEIFYKTDLNKLQFIKTRGSYIQHQFEAAVLYVHRPGYANKHTIEMRYRDIRVGDTVVKLNREYYDSSSNKLKLMEFTYRYDLNKVDNWNYPLSGLKVVGYAIVRAGIEGMGFQSQILAEAGYFKRIRKKWFLSEILRGRLTAPERQPYAFRYALGSNSEYIRGYEYYVIDGSQYAIFRSNVKYELLNVTIRNFPLNFLSVIPFRVYPKLFFDAGYVDNRFPGNSFLNNKALAGYGVGVDIVSAYDFKFRLEYAWNDLGQKGLFLHINSE